MSKARRIESSLHTFSIPSNSGFTPSARMRFIFQRFVEIGSVTTLAKELQKQGCRSKV